MKTRTLTQPLRYRLTRPVSLSIFVLAQFHVTVFGSFAPHYTLQALAGVEMLRIFITHFIEGRMQMIARAKATDAAVSDRPPRYAEFLMFIAFPRIHREATVGDLNEDLALNVTPRFGPVLAWLWYWYKAVLYVALYFYQAAAKPFFETVVWKSVVRPIVKFVLTPVVIVQKLGWMDLIREFLNKHFR